MIKKIFLFAAIIALIFTIVRAYNFYPKQTNINSNCKQTSKIIKLTKPTDTKLIVLETGPLMITFGLSDLESIQSNDSSGKIDSNFLAYIKDQLKKSDKVHASDYEQDPNYLESHSGEYITASLLERGKLIMFNKMTGGYENQIEVSTDDYRTCRGMGGRHFLLPERNNEKTQFLFVMDFIE